MFQRWLSKGAKDSRDAAVPSTPHDIDGGGRPGGVAATDVRLESPKSRVLDGSAFWDRSRKLSGSGDDDDGSSGGYP
jgi:hypothetical protein